MSDYEVSRAAGRCAVTGREFQEGEPFFTALFESPQGFERKDYAPEAWQGPPEGCLCHFQTRLPKKEEGRRKLFVDDDVLTNFFLRLADADEPMKLRFRFVLSLVMLRKRLLKYERTWREAGREFWEMKLMRDRSLHRVLNPVLDETEIHHLTGELSVILSGQVPDMAEDGGVADESPQVEPAPCSGVDEP